VEVGGGKRRICFFAGFQSRSEPRLFTPLKSAPVKARLINFSLATLPLTAMDYDREQGNIVNKQTDVNAGRAVPFFLIQSWCVTSPRNLPGCSAGVAERTKSGEPWRRFKPEDLECRK
jgi:hypothetical protein